MAFKVQVQAYDGVTTADSTVVTTNYPPPAAIGTPGTPTASVPAFGQVLVEWGYTTQAADTLLPNGYFLVYIGASSTPDWNSATTYTPASVTTSYSTTITTALTGSVYIAVRAVGEPTSLTSDSAAVAFSMPLPPARPLKCDHLSQFAGIPPQGTVTGVTLAQSGYFGINITWGYEPDVDDPQDTVFGIYLNGRLKQIQPGNVRATTIIAPNETTHEIEVIAWPAAYDMPDTNYSSFATRRAHLEWDPVVETDLITYVIYHSTTSTAGGGTFTEYDTQTTVEVDGSSFDFTSGATAIISGAPGEETPEYSNCTFTITITDAALQKATVTNSADATSIPISYAIGQPVTILEGISIVITEAPIAGDTLTFPVRVATYYDTDPLADGTHYFKIKAKDSAGNLSAFSNEIAVTISIPPAAVTAWAVGYDRATNAVTYTVTQSADGASVAVYSNYNPDTDTLMDEVYYHASLTTFVLAANATGTGTLLSDAHTLTAGDYIFVARSVDADGVESDDTTADTITLPYTADQPHVVSAEITQDGTDVTVTFITDGLPADNAVWRISWAPSGAISGQIVLSEPTVSTDENGNTYYTYTQIITTTIIGATGEITFTIAAYDNTTGTVLGEPYTLTYTLDTTAPDAPGNATGVAY